jgi:N-acetylmuramoyl-L-alanine amidase
VVRFRIWLATALASGAITGSLLHAQVSDEEKSRRDESGQGETHSSPVPKLKKSPSPVAKASTDKSRKQHRASATSEKAPTAIPHAKLAKEESTDDHDASQDEGASSRHPKAKLAKKSGNEEEATPKPTPRETPESGSSSKSKRRHTPTPKPKAAKKKSHEKETSHKTKKGGKTKSTQQEEETPKPKKTPTPGEERKPSSESSGAARAVAVPTPAPTPQSKAAGAVARGDRAQVVIEKSGVEEDQGFEPPPSPPPRRGFWPWSRSSGNYRYLTRSVIDAIRRAPVKRRRWQFIVVHNSGTRQGNARVFDYYHRHVRRMQNGLAYHFVIGNGTSTGNGQIEVGDRWRRQINGGHVHSDYLNNISLGICLVGDFNRDQPTRAQLDACEELIRYLRERCGKTDRGTIPVRPHREINPPRWPTDCPGDDFPYSWFRRF